MSSINLERFKNRHPEEREAIERLERLLREGKRRSVTFERLSEMVDARSSDDFAVILGEIAGSGLINFKWQVYSPKTHAPLRSFSSFSEIPVVMHDRESDREFQVTPEDVKAVYDFPSCGPQ